MNKKIIRFLRIKGSGADSGKRVLCIKVWGFALLILSHFSQISYENEIIWSHGDQIISFS